MPRAWYLACFCCWFGAASACTRLTAVDWDRIPSEAGAGADGEGRTLTSGGGSPGTGASASVSVGQAGEPSGGGAGGAAGSADEHGGEQP